MTNDEIDAVAGAAAKLAREQLTIPGGVAVFVLTGTPADPGELFVRTNIRRDILVAVLQQFIKRDVH